MKRKGNLYKQIYEMDNLILADNLAQKGKRKRPDVILHNLNNENNFIAIQKMLQEEAFTTSGYKTFKIHDPKERLIYCLPYYPDRIIQHAIMNALEQMFINVFTKDTYSCIRGRGIHAAARAVKKSLKNREETIYCLKLDIKKYYPSIDHSVLKSLLRKKIKDTELLALLDNIIDSAPGLPIGNYLSQFLANFYLSYFDHWLKEIKGIKYYFRYADDMVILSDNKTDLHQLFNEIKKYLADNLKLEVKYNWQVFPVASRGIDFVGYVFFHTHTLLRKSIKKSFARSISKKPNQQTLAAYMGWVKHCDSRNLLSKVLKEKK